MSLEIDVRAGFTAEGADRFEVLADLEIPAGETLVILGPSGSGKSLLLETVAGFHDHEGSVSLGGRDLTDLPPEDRGLGFVFQDYALFPHLSVRENVAFGGRYHDIRDPDALLAEFGVADLAERYPPTLSGGERQRVALARALAVGPDAFLLDEPLSALDVPTRAELRELLADVMADETAVYVTHNRTTARVLADRIAVIRDGRIVQTGTPDELFERPDSPFVARFTGANCLALDGGALRVPGGRLVVGDGEHLAIRPEHVELRPRDAPSASPTGEADTDESGGGDAGSVAASADGPGDGDFEFVAPVERVLREDGRCRVVLDVAGQRLDAYAPTGPAGDSVGVVLPRERTTLLAE
ncbi:MULTISPECIES: ABC transporter ATP-binding protein [Halorussus]|uniref:ABC transporter ATP-binding protein n=1 Tax=Halorussus TaxID=1070314 RepID=UPI00209CED8C|nr:ABC transporter ATP-binding protein [Halorussus vallis]USZ77541.1 ABC transporter ATP-binding protein [Halorussus vallis]